MVYLRCFGYRKLWEIEPLRPIGHITEAFGLGDFGLSIFNQFRKNWPAVLQPPGKDLSLEWSYLKINWADGSPLFEDPYERIRSCISRKTPIFEEFRKNSKRVGKWIRQGKYFNCFLDPDAPAIRGIFQHFTEQEQYPVIIPNFRSRFIPGIDLQRHQPFWAITTDKGCYRHQRDGVTITAVAPTLKRAEARLTLFCNDKEQFSNMPFQISSNGTATVGLPYPGAGACRVICHVETEDGELGTECEFEVYKRKSALKAETASESPAETIFVGTDRVEISTKHIEGAIHAYHLFIKEPSETWDGPVKLRSHVSDKIQLDVVRPIRNVTLDFYNPFTGEHTEYFADNLDEGATIEHPLPGCIGFLFIGTWEDDRFWEGYTLLTADDNFKMDVKMESELKVNSEAKAEIFTNKKIMLRALIRDIRSPQGQDLTHVFKRKLFDTLRKCDASVLNLREKAKKIDDIFCWGEIHLNFFGGFKPVTRDPSDVITIPDWAAFEESYDDLMDEDSLEIGEEESEQTPELPTRDVAFHRVVEFPESGALPFRTPAKPGNYVFDVFAIDPVNLAYDSISVPFRVKSIR